MRIIKMQGSKSLYSAASKMLSIPSWDLITLKNPTARIQTWRLSHAEWTKGPCRGPIIWIGNNGYTSFHQRILELIQENIYINLEYYDGTMGPCKSVVFIKFNKEGSLLTTNKILSALDENILPDILVTYIVFVNNTQCIRECTADEYLAIKAACKDWIVPE